MNQIDIVGILFTEVAKCISTFLIGFMTFKIYERYKNRKEYNEIFIILLKLEREIDKVMGILKDAMEENIRLGILQRAFSIDNEINSDVCTFFDKVEDLSYYEDDFKHYGDDGEIVDVERTYFEKQWVSIDHLERTIYDIENPHQDDMFNEEIDKSSFEELSRQLEEIKERSIFDEFKEIEDLAGRICENNIPMKDVILDIEKRFHKFNELECEKKVGYLSRIYKFINSENHEFGKYLNMYRQMKNFKNIVITDEIRLKEWDKQDSKTIALFDSELYIKLEKVYYDYNKLISTKQNIEEAEDVEELYKLLKYQLRESVKCSKRRVQKNLKKVRRYFGGV